MTYVASHVCGLSYVLFTVQLLLLVCVCFNAGGHNYEANSLVGGGVVIDLMNLQDLKIDSKANTMTVGAGYRLVSGVGT
jgi:hypothetical protein